MIRLVCTRQVMRSQLSLPYKPNRNCVVWRVTCLFCSRGLLHCSPDAHLLLCVSMIRVTPYITDCRNWVCWMHIHHLNYKIRLALVVIYFHHHRQGPQECQKKEQEVKVIWQKVPHGGPIPWLGVSPGGQNLYHWIPGVGVPISVP